MIHVLGRLSHGPWSQVVASLRQASCVLHLHLVHLIICVFRELDLDIDFDLDLDFGINPWPLAGLRRDLDNDLGPDLDMD